jgi:hypothetical protein
MKLKNILFWLPMLLATTNLLAQPEIKDKNLLIQELDSTVEAKNLPLNSFALTPAGDWLILFGDIGYSYIRTTPKIENTLQSYNAEKVYLKDIDFYENAGWSLITKHNAYTGDKIPEHIKNQLQSINQQKETIKCLDFNKSGAGFILYGYNKFYAKDLPKTFTDKMKDLQGRNQRVKYAAVNDDNSWVILYGKYGFSYYKTKDSLNDKLKLIAGQRKTLNRVFLEGDYWILTSDDAKIDSNL